MFYLSQGDKRERTLAAHGHWPDWVFPSQPILTSKVVSFVGAGHRGVDWMPEPCWSCELREIDRGVPLPGPGAGRRRRVDGPRLRQITGTSADRRVGGGRGPRFPLPAHRCGRLRPLSPARDRGPPPGGDTTPDRTPPSTPVGPTCKPDWSSGSGPPARPRLPAIL